MFGRSRSTRSSLWRGSAAGLALTVAACAGATHPAIPVVPLAHGPREMPDDQQIRHALNRLTFGPRPGDYQRVRAIGLDRWIGEQLTPAAIANDSVDRFLERYPAIALSDTALARIYGAPGDLRKTGGATPDTTAIRAADRASAQVIAQLREAKVARAVLSERQLLEEMVDFWENHFSIFADKGSDRYMLVAYDRDIRRHALGKFRDLLGAVAHSPAMLYYLDNWQSRADSAHMTLTELEAYERSVVAQRNYERARSQIVMDRAGRVTIGNPNVRPPTPYRRPVRRGAGLNENYGRELMELHTLGVDGGYTQQDVIEAARILTGWTIRDPNHIGTFYFNPALHDAESKVVLGQLFPAGHGEDEGERLLDMLAREPATAHFVALKLCRRFVADSPSADLVQRAAETFTRTDGDIAQVMRTVLESPEFFSAPAYRAKVKSPFEVVVSTLRALDATPDTLQRDVQAVARLGEPIFGHIAPNGYPEIGAEWMNTGAILNRINFGYQTAAGQIPGASLRTWAPAAALQRAPRDAQVEGVIAILLGGDVSPQTRQVLMAGNNPLAPAGAPSAVAMTPAPHPPAQQSSLAQIVGLALGAPEFERR